MNPTVGQSNEATHFKGLLPAHMRQGIPPYLQILFAARPKLPYLPPVPRSRPLKMQGFFCNIDFQKVKEDGEKAKQERLQKGTGEDQEFKDRIFYESIVKAERGKRWKQQMEQHIERQREDYQQWLEAREKAGSNRSYEPQNTLIVSKLVR